MFSKSQIKFINSLSRKKYRQEHQLFLVEGKKAINELLSSSLELHSLYTTEDIFPASREKIYLISAKDLSRISRLSTPQLALALFHFPVVQEPELKGLILALDGVQDPGNLGTIIRMCDWFGVKHIICSSESVDCFNPKVVQATMGSISRVNVFYTCLTSFLQKASGKTPVYGAFLEGRSVYHQELELNGILVMGNEANGITPEVASYVTRKIMIPQFGDSLETESLNVATATAILLSEFSRRVITEK